MYSNVVVFTDSDASISASVALVAFVAVAAVASRVALADQQLRSLYSPPPSRLELQNKQSRQRLILKQSSPKSSPEGQEKFLMANS